MKKITSSIIFFFFVSNCYSQGGNLQFNQVLNIKNGDNYIVPAGKVVKVESIYTDYRNWSVAYNNVGCTYSSSYLYGTRCNYLIANNGLLNHIGIPNAPFTLYKVGEISAKLGFNGEDIQYVNDTLIFESSFGCNGCGSSLQLTLIQTGNIPHIELPLWLNSGQNISITSLPNPNSLPGQKGIGAFITAIEYNVIP
jgi:hypothetical protein